MTVKNNDKQYFYTLHTVHDEACLSDNRLD